MGEGGGEGFGGWVDGEGELGEGFEGVGGHFCLLMIGWEEVVVVRVGLVDLRECCPRRWRSGRFDARS